MYIHTGKTTIYNEVMELKQPIDWPHPELLNQNQKITSQRHSQHVTAQEVYLNSIKKGLASSIAEFMRGKQRLKE